ncbi:kelch-like protein 10 [Dermacentor silvarum]|uniref:kelch-like protein 10 n=1 Tax=Dermacentor silvarum TaxID=543639 RepID=UPI002100BDEC|nr:kelch-like protein 10 [Dermacentor silvarum]
MPGGTIIQIRDHCLNTLKHNLEPESCIDTYRLASSGGYDYLAKVAFRYIVRNFDEVWKNSAQFQALTPEEMCSILEDDRLHAPNEVEETFRAILKWISADVDERKAYLAKFLPLVRFARCSVTDIENVVTTPQILGDGDSMKVLNVIHQTLSLPSMAVGEVAGVDLSPKLWLKPRLPKNILFLFGGWTVGATNKMLTFYCRAAKWRMMGKQNTTPRAYHGVAVIGQCIYFVGGFNGRECYHSVACFDLSLARWSAKANMAKARCYVSVAVLQGHIYAMGGFDGHMRTNTVERYEVNTNQWSMVANMNDIRSDASAAAAGGRIYM